MIYYFTPFIKNNLGQAYNHYCNLVPNDDDWITMMDGDIMQLHLDWGEKWSSIIENNSDAGIISCVTNRIGCPLQKIGSMFNETSLVKHRNFAKQLFDKYQYSVQKINISPNYSSCCMSGFFFSFKKSTWKAVGGFNNGTLNVDTNFFKKVIRHKPCYIAQGFYVLHYYRLLEGKDFKQHLKIK